MYSLRQMRRRLKLLLGTSQAGGQAALIPVLGPFAHEQAWLKSRESFQGWGAGRWSVIWEELSVPSVCSVW